MDKIRRVIQHGETDKIEFKETFCWDVRNKKKNKDLSDKIFKTIAAFLNTKGGRLVIGVDDKGTVTGLEDELEKLHKGNLDKFQRSFKDGLKAIGTGNIPLVEQYILEMDQKKIFIIECEEPSESDDYVYFKDELYIRTGPATEKLEGRDLIEYTRTRARALGINN